MSVWIGTSGWSYDDWVGSFYPPGSASRDYLSLYATRFSAVEIDSTFYAIPAATTFEGWAERTPAGFRFAPKVFRVVTHGSEGERVRVEKVLADESGELERFLQGATLLGEKLACVVFQFPYFRVKELTLGDFLPRLDRVLERVADKVRVAVEIRNKMWITQEYLAVLRNRKAAAVLVDHPYMPGPEDQVAKGMVTADFTYVRLLGDRHAIEAKTKTWGATVEDKKERIARWGKVIRMIIERPDVKDVYAFSNNHFAGHAPATCVELAHRIGGPS